MHYAGKHMYNLLALLCLLTLASSLLADAGRDREQAELDAACEAAREKVLTPLRQQMVEQCVQTKEQPGRAACTDYYRDYGARAGRRAPLFYDLPECVKAFEFQSSERQR